MTMNPFPPQMDTLIERILDLSAEAQIKRREIPATSLAFHHLTGAIVAYGNVLRLLTKAHEAPGEHYLLIKPVQFAASAGRAL
jgi:hypothetical protein